MQAACVTHSIARYLVHVNETRTHRCRKTEAIAGGMGAIRGRQTRLVGRVGVEPGPLAPRVTIAPRRQYNRIGVARMTLNVSARVSREHHGLGRGLAATRVDLPCPWRGPCTARHGQAAPAPVGLGGAPSHVRWTKGTRATGHTSA